MGIKGLIPFLQEVAPKAIKQMIDMKSYTGKTLAIDASMCLYQFLIAIRTGDGEAYGGLTNEDGETTSHVVGFLNRTLKLLEAGLKPVYVFDGKPPELKTQEVAARREKRHEAERLMAEAKEAGDEEAYKKAMDRTVRGTKKQNDDVKNLLRLMGIPVIDAPCEAEATCASLCKENLVYASATEDADCLTFGTKRLVRNLFATDHKKRPILEVNLETSLQVLDIDMDRFIEFCILCGCDYTDTIRGIGNKTAFKLIKLHGNMENVLANIDREKHPLPEPFLWKESLHEFKNPAVTDKTEARPLMMPTPPKYEELSTFLREKMSFAPDRVERALARLRSARNMKTQVSMTAYVGEQKPIIRPEDIYNPFKTAARAKTVGGFKRKGILTAASLEKKRKAEETKDNAGEGEA
eukprot:GEMP01038813.1.p1 GENE.GEMP01038813.1~~GEMP01038813.1.p1  ORF type:complete len:433 (+),score=117.01 GEMP01038813.1:75-1301(+)